MNIDTSFKIGSTHEVCQDYTLSSLTAMVLSDGCSQAPLSDIGARILCSMSMKMLKENSVIPEPDQVLKNSKEAIRVLSLPPSVLDATLLTVVFNNNQVNISACGDGFVVFKKKKSNEIIVFKISYNSSIQSLSVYPDYLCYPERLKAWFETGVQKKITIYCINEEKSQVITSTFDAGETFFESSFGQDYFLGDNGKAVVSHTKTNSKFIIENLSDIEYIAISSDGLDTFYTKKDGVQKVVPFVDVINNLFCFKNFNGVFVQRRLNKFEQFCSKNGWFHADDLSLGVIYLGE